MAEANPSQSEAIRRYFCHRCNKHVSPKLPEIACSICDSGFIEEVPEEPDHLPTQEQGEERTGSRHGFDEYSSYGNDPDRDRDESLGAAAAASYPSSRLMYRQMALPPRPQSSAISLRRLPASFGPRGAPFDILSHLLSTFSEAGALGGIQILHGNPGDYAWGTNGLDAIITQLLNNMDASGPPPADRSTISALPAVKVSKNQVDAKAQCSVCFDEFSVGDDALSLPCKHLYHKDCIIKWLEMHGTCPVCRKDLNGADTSTQEYAELAETLTSLEEQTAGHSSQGTGGSTVARSATPSAAQGEASSSTQQPPSAPPGDHSSPPS